MVSREAAAVVALLIIIVSLQNFDAHAESSQGVIGYPAYTGNRDHVFLDSRIDFCTFSYDDKYNDMAVRAVNEWHKNITKVTGNNQVWNMVVHIEPKDLSICDGFINYYKTPEETLHQVYGIAGYSNPYNKIANVTVYTDFYQETLRNLPKEQKEKMTLEQFKNIVKNYSHDTFDDKTIYRTTLHEIGHALSLNHPSEAKLGKLHEAKGIMSYNPDEVRILPEEIKQIVKSYPNGFIERSISTQPLDGDRQSHTFFVGERANIIVELPNDGYRDSFDSISLYIIPNSRSEIYHDAPIKIIKKSNGLQIVNDGEYFAQIKAVPVNWMKGKSVITMHFIPNRLMENTDIIVVTTNNIGLSKEWKIKNVFSVENALFSDILLQDKSHDWSWNFALRS